MCPSSSALHRDLFRRTDYNCLLLLLPALSVKLATRRDHLSSGHPVVTRRTCHTTRDFTVGTPNPASHQTLSVTTSAVSPTEYPLPESHPLSLLTPLPSLLAATPAALPTEYLFPDLCPPSPLTPLPSPLLRSAPSSPETPPTPTSIASESSLGSPPLLSLSPTQMTLITTITSHKQCLKL